MIERAVIICALITAGVAVHNYIPMNGERENGARIIKTEVMHDAGYVHYIYSCNSHGNHRTVTGKHGELTPYLDCGEIQ